ncbi:glycosyltransferase [Acidiferrimicrobium sp. IK]|uniref:glycosyltransferase n=1 Tax=Acidiferrimicrobium sp. IK TaxID=2871700 RepID=UPI0021CB5B85|nr:glycosyltransferase [Acidiferrimicrobium sp. IK]MCU4187333.1 glycosyltransferase [Acidiferrimicrobium sp. IK]
MGAPSPEAGAGPGGLGAVTVDLQAAQSAGYRDRGVARYALDFTTSLVERHPDLLEQVVLDPDLPPVGVEHLMAQARVTRSGSWSPGADGGIFHVLSPFELAVGVRRLWPRRVSQRQMATVVTVYDLIPELFPDIYLRDEGLRRRYRARRELIRVADHVMTLSRSAADDVIDHLGVPESRVTVVGAATGAAFRRPASKDAARAALSGLVAGIEPGFIVYNGAVEPRKNMEALLEAYAQLPARLRAEHQLVLVCKLAPLERNHFEVRAAQLGVAGQVVLTGYLPDATLVALYQTTDLAVFPSLYEGYGLPVAEAIACGAPAIASGNSSLVELVAPEATFDPSSPAAIAAAVHAGLSDHGLRARLLAWSDRPQPTWAGVADRAAEVYRGLLPPAGARPVRRWRRRPSLALVTPWPPSLTGVASYSRRLVDALRAYCDVDVYTDGDPVEDTERGGVFDPAGIALRDLTTGGYDSVIVALGNSEFHANALRILRTSPIPVVAQVHDVRLANLWLHSAARGAVPEGFEQAVADHYPGLSNVVRDGRIPSDVAAREGIFMLSEIVARSERTLVTSEFAADVARLDCRSEDREKVAVWPYAYPPAVGRAAGGVDPDLVCTFGLVNEAKRPDLLVSALALLLPRRPHLRLAFVGPAGADQRQAIAALAEQLGVSDRVVVTGEVADDDYEQWLRRAAVAAQLRRYTNGECSGAVADCLCHGVPTVVSALGPQSELAAVTAQLPAGAGAGAADLAELLESTLADPAGRESLGDRGRRWAAERSFDWAARQLFALLPDLGRRPGAPSAAGP